VCDRAPNPVNVLFNSLGRFAPECMNRIDKRLVFHPLRSEQLEKVLEIELGMVQQRVLETATGRFVFHVTQPAKDFLLRADTDRSMV
jgi:ATP-dependent Clp protease ATP-binding subunit ClpA